jgi:Carboxypeptidase regulatory-like domain
MRARHVVRNTALTALWWIVAVLPALAQGVGAIGGIITDDSNAILPGVAVTLVSPGIIGGNRTTVTDGQGAYQFVRLVPGRYSVKAELAGFRTSIQENIVVDADKTSRADLKLPVGAIEEAVTVSGDSPLLDTTSTLKQAVMSREILDTIPMAQDIWSIARVAEGVHLSKYDVGGRQMLAQSTATSHNSSTQNYQVDGMDINSYSGGISFYVDSFQYQEINYQTDNQTASAYSGGVGMNMISKTGTNRFQGSAMFHGATHQMESDNVGRTSPLAQSIAAQIPAKVLATNPDMFYGGDTLHIFDSGVAIGGPIIRDKLWFQASYYGGSLYQHLLGSYNTDGTLLLVTNRFLEPTGKISWAINRNNQLHVTESRVGVTRPQQAGGPTVTQYFSYEASLRNLSANTLQMARWTSILSPHMLLDAGFMTTNGQTNSGPQLEVVHDGSIPHFDSVLLNNTVAASNYAINSGRRSQVMATLSYSSTKHQLQGGYQFYVTENERGTYGYAPYYPLNMQAVYSNGVPTSVKTFNAPTDYFRRAHETGVYLQDKWTPISRLTLNLGVRFARSVSWLNDHQQFGLTVDATPICQVQTIFVAGQCFPAVIAPELNLVTPHFSLVYDLKGDGRTALKFSANQYQQQQVALADRVNPVGTTSDTRAWTVCAPGQTSGCDLNGDKEPQLNEFGVSSGFNSGTTNRFDPNLKFPYDIEVSAGFEQQLPADLVFSANYFFRGHRNQIGATNLAVPTSTYIPLEVTEVNSGQRVTVYNQNPALAGKFDVLFANSPLLNSNFNGADFSLNKRMSHHWSLLASLSLSHNVGDVYCGGIVLCTAAISDLNNPNFGFRSGPGPQEVPVFAKVSGVYELPKGFSTGFSGSYFKGWPDRTTVLVQANTVRLTQGTQAVTVEPVGTSTLPSINLWDFNLRKSFKAGRFTLDPRVDMYNAFNVAAATSWITQLGTTYHRPIAITGGRLIKAGLNMTF